MARLFYKKNENNVDIPVRVEVIGKEVRTPEGIRIDDSYGNLRAVYPTLQLNGTPDVGWTFATVNRVYFRLTSYNEVSTDMKVESYDSIIYMGFNWE